MSIRAIRENDPEEAAIREFLRQRKTREITMGPSEGFDISDPRGNDMDAWKSGRYSITRCFAVGDPGKEEFHFYIGPEGIDGSTEIHMMNASAQKVREIMEMIQSKL